MHPSGLSSDYLYSIKLLISSSSYRRMMADVGSDAELEVMRILWREKQAVTFSDIRTELSDKMSWDSGIELQQNS